MLLLSFITFLFVFVLGTLPTTAAVIFIYGRGRLPNHTLPMAGLAVTATWSYITFWAFFAHPWLGSAIAVAILASSALFLCHKRKLLATVFSLQADSRAAFSIMLLVGCGYIGVLCARAWDEKASNVQSLASQRFGLAMPIDNEIPRFFAERLAKGESPKNLLDGWLSSDRPPLQTGVILLIGQPARALGIDIALTTFCIGLWFQLLWVPALWGLLRTLGAKHQFTAWVVSITACTGFCLHNSVYTWPKLAAAAFVVAAVSLLIARKQASLTEHWIWIGGMLALGHLAHSGVAFSLLALPFLFVSRDYQPRFRHAVAAGIIFMLFSTPWLLYQKFYEPPANRLLKWHLAGAVEIDDRSFGKAIADAYGQLTWKEFWESKQKNLLDFLPDDYAQIIEVSTDRQRANGRRNTEFFRLCGALAIGNLALVLLPFTTWCVWRRSKDDVSLKAFLALLGWLTCTLIVWVLLMFIPRSTVVHQGSFVPLLLLFALPMLMAAMCHKGLFLFLAAAQLISFVTTWWPGQINAPQSASGSAVAVSVASLGGLIWFAVNSWESKHTPTLVRDDAAPHS